MKKNIMETICIWIMNNIGSIFGLGSLCIAVMFGLGTLSMALFTFYGIVTVIGVLSCRYLKKLGYVFDDENERV